MISALTSISPIAPASNAGMGDVQAMEAQKEQEDRQQAELNPALASAAGAITRQGDSVDLSRTSARSRSGERATESSNSEPKAQSATGEALSPDEQKQVEKLQERDAEVRQHEQAHVAAAGPHFRGGPNYSYQTGPDGKKYAVGGSVQIDTSPVPGDPEATIAKAQQVRRAALAPVEPSNTDRQVAAAASRMEAEARAELSEKQADKSDQGATSTQTDESDSEAGSIEAPEATVANSDTESTTTGKQRVENNNSQRVPIDPYA